MKNLFFKNNTFCLDQDLNPRPSMILSLDNYITTLDGQPECQHFIVIWWHIDIVLSLLTALISNQVLSNNSHRKDFIFSKMEVDIKCRWKIFMVLNSFFTAFIVLERFKWQFSHKGKIFIFWTYLKIFEHSMSEIFTRRCLCSRSLKNGACNTFAARMQSFLLLKRRSLLVLIWFFLAVYTAAWWIWRYSPFPWKF